VHVIVGVTLQYTDSQSDLGCIFAPCKQYVHVQMITFWEISAKHDSSTYVCPDQANDQGWWEPEHSAGTNSCPSNASFNACQLLQLLSKKEVFK